METISFLALMFLSLAGFSAGATGKAGKFRELKPQVLDLLLIVVIFAGAIYFRITLDLNKWLVVLIWVILSIIIGTVSSIFNRKLPEKKLLGEKKEATSRNPVKKQWQDWKQFSKRMGSFQSRIILSLFFFLIVSPFALALKIFSDPLKIKKHYRESYWLPKKDIKADLDQFRRQF